MHRFTHFANVETAVPGAEWAGLTECQRVDRIMSALQASQEQFLFRVDVISAKVDGQVIVHMKNSLPANQRGTFLLDLEEYIKVSVDEALSVWLEPFGDRSSLRNLRGIEVKAS
jgi:hypothetical protein